MKKRYKTRSGCEVNIWTFDSRQGGLPIRGEILATDGVWRCANWSKDFRHLGGKLPSPNDLVEAHSCADLRPGDAVAVTDDLEDSAVVLRYIGYTSNGAVYTENIHDGAIQSWEHGKPA